MQFDSSKPIWQQLLAEFRLMIITEKWQPGAKIPSTRELALQYRVNPNTVQRALTELDRLGETIADRAVGRTVAIAPEAIAAARQVFAEDILVAAAKKLQSAGVTLAEAQKILTERW